MVETIDLRNTFSNHDAVPGVDSAFIGPYDMVYNGCGFVYCTNNYNNSISK